MFAGIESQTSRAYTPEQNGVAERENQHLLEVTKDLPVRCSPHNRMTYQSDAI